MKLLIVALVTLIISSESFAQYRDGRGNGRRNGNRGGISVDVGGVRIGIGRGGIRVGSNRGSNRYSRNSYYSCNYDSLYYNNQFIHTFNYSYCSNAVNDIQNYGYFCDGTDMYTANGNFDSSYFSANECRTALRY